MNKRLTKEELKKEEFKKTVKKETRRNKKKRRAYRFTLDINLHKDLIEFLEGVPKVLRGGYCIEGLKLLKEKMSSNLEEKRTIDFKKLLK